MLKAVGGSENPGAQLVICWAYFAPVVEIELTDQLTDLPKSRIAMAPPAPLAPTDLGSSASPDFGRNRSLFL